jgi:hypothetical protein
MAAHKDRAQSLAFHPDGKLLLSTGWEGTLHLWLAD